MSQVKRYTGQKAVQLVADIGGHVEGAAVILLHGGGQTRHSWRGAFDALVAAGYHVISYDARGHGESDWSPDGDYTLPVLAADLQAIVDTLETPPTLVGASMGAATAFYLAGATRSAGIGALVMVDLVPRVEQAGADRILAFMRAYPEGFATVEEAADAVCEYYPHRPRPRDPSGLMKNLRRGENGRLYWHWDPKMLEQDDRPEPPPSLADRMSSVKDGISVPVMLIRGTRSDIVSDAGVAEFRQMLPQLEVVDVSGAGHMVAGDSNDAFNSGLLDFLARNRL